ncbi:MAG: acyl carrier protein [gamma proteobacterium endosymbiont of Lamellibrachia anaximandri]|nr:acyl carrier protein [gamma proteobacterium endosymbiont of Lamellibrachia anaximandri]MBL3533284.1 acyl carrier protein [gamma proteobacterium endosymbiont of Lamellibrachia anaximandri]MBL3599266.1 acyl carrier protein [gamma proteobacterium endosymbiont of Lamellibrachia anaximandri]
MGNPEQRLDREEIKARLREIIQAQLEEDEVEYDENNLDNLSELEIDSLSFVEIIFVIEDKFDVKSGGFSDEQLKEIKTTDDIADLIIAAKSAS